MKKHPVLAFILGTTVGIVVGRKILTDKNMERIENEFETLFDKINNYGTEDNTEDFADLHPKSTRYVHIPIKVDHDEKTETKEIKQEHPEDIKVDVTKVDEILKTSEEKQQESMRKVRSRSKIQKKKDIDEQEDKSKLDNQ